MQLGLGTAQFGMDYGLSNRLGRTRPDEVARILTHAAAAGMRVLDTAALYGDSEAVLGAALKAGHSFRIVTKTPAFGAARITRAEASALKAGFERSRARLRQDRLYGLMIHAPGDLLRPGGELLWAAMSALKQDRLVEKIGVSVYSGAEIDSILERFPPDLVQLPLNVLDQRLVQSGHLARVKARGIEIHARSVFLQGLLLLLDAPTLPAQFSEFRGELERVRETCRRLSVSPLELALAFVKSVSEVDTAVVGVERLDQLVEVLAAFGSGAARPADYASLACGDERLVNPSLWRLQPSRQPA